ncbi:hypothetical protein F183_A51600 [Bryobacterales bacterium F-183]|nr:hypothetical protein F183_A51600 [Bryobacterales bacterium F-183]
MATKQLVEAPAGAETLAYIEAYDAILDADYAYVAYREVDSDGTTWRVRIKGLHTAGSVLEPEAIRLQARSAGAQGKPYFVWGYQLEPSAGDVRHVETRVHVQKGKASEVEMYLRMRLYSGEPDEPKSVRFPWPAA